MNEFVRWSLDYISEIGWFGNCLNVAVGFLLGRFLADRDELIKWSLIAIGALIVLAIMWTNGIGALISGWLIFIIPMALISFLPVIVAELFLGGLAGKLVKRS